MKKKKKFKITYGGWYQRTTIHLSEVYYFLALGKSDLPLDPKEVHNLQRGLNLKEVTREAGYLEYVKAVTKEGIIIRYYEDGLYVLELVSDDIKKGAWKLKRFYYDKLDPAIKYIFSLGAPTPKILANIKTVHPFVIGFQDQKHDDYDIDEKKYGDVYSKIVADDISVYKTPEFIFVISEKARFELIKELNEMQLFFREFKDHLEKYLEIHRIVWEDISKIKRKRSIRGEEIEKVRFRLDSYFKTVTLVSHRINQMGTYVKTRSSIAQSMEIEKYLLTLFQYKFEVLTNTLEYIKEIWAMTGKYLNSAIDIVVELQNKSADNSLKSLRFITTFGVIASTISYISVTRIPQLTTTSVYFFVGLLIAALIIDRLLVYIYKRIKYKLNVSKDMRKF